MDIDEDSGLLVVLSAEPATTEDAAEGATRLQMVLEMDEAIWKVRALSAFSPLPSLVNAKHIARSLGLKGDDFDAAE